MRLLFKRARRHKPAIIFFDEIDAVCGTRKDDAADHENRLKNEFLVQMDGLNHDNNGVLFLAATNLPWKIDPAFIRRFQKRIEVPLPNDEARLKLFEIEIGGTLCNLSPDDYEELAERADGFSGSDIKTVVQDALNCPVKRVVEATHFSEVSSTSLNDGRPQRLTLFLGCSAQIFAMRADGRGSEKNELARYPNESIRGYARDTRGFLRSALRSKTVRRS